MIGAGEDVLFGFEDGLVCSSRATNKEEEERANRVTKQEDEVARTWQCISREQNCLHLTSLYHSLHLNDIETNFFQLFASNMFIFNH